MAGVVIDDATLCGCRTVLLFESVSKGKRVMACFVPGMRCRPAFRGKPYLPTLLSLKPAAAKQRSGVLFDPGD